jgi:hemerythrin-like domain-containing protein
MKRTKYLERLSHDHHEGLVAVAYLKKASSSNTPSERLALYVRDLWDKRLSPHFQDEEDHLLPAIEGTPLASLGERMVEEHRTIEALVRDVTTAGKPTDDQIANLADSLKRHIRFEERELFPALEAGLSDDVLLGIASRLSSVSDESDG